MDSRDVEFNRPSRLPRQRNNQPSPHAPRRHPKFGGDNPTPTQTIEEDISGVTDGVVSFFTLPPTESNGISFSIVKIKMDPENPHDWLSIVVNKTRSKDVTGPDGKITKLEVAEGSPLELSQKLFDASIVMVEERMKKLTQEQKFGSPDYVQQQLTRERMLDVYRHASEAS